MSVTKTRTSCIFCKCEDITEVLPVDIHIPQSTLMKDDSHDSEGDDAWMMFNIQHCNRCLAYQTKYLADPIILYGGSHIHPIGKIRETMDDILCNMIVENSLITGIIEIGGGKGLLADKIIDSTIGTIPYYIVDSCYIGNTYKRIVIPHFIEDCHTSLPSTPNTLILSHVFEHFYDPVAVLKSLIKPNIKYIYVCHPDFDSYISKQPYTMNVLHIEHTFLIDNEGVKKIMNTFNFKLSKETLHANYCVMWEFVRTDTTPKALLLLHDLHINTISHQCIPRYLSYISSVVNKVNHILNSEKYQDYKKYIWPCSIHTVTLLHYGVHVDMLDGMLDNSKDKIGRKIYGYNLPCLSFATMTSQNKENCVIFLNGGCFNKEVMQNDTEHVQFVCL